MADYVGSCRRSIFIEKCPSAKTCATVFVVKLNRTSVKVDHRSVAVSNYAYFIELAIDQPLFSWPPEFEHMIDRGRRYRDYARLRELGTSQYWRFSIWIAI